MHQSLLNQTDAVEQCRTLDTNSTLFRYTQAEIDSVVLHLNNGEPVVSNYWTKPLIWHLGIREQGFVDIIKTLAYFRVVKPKLIPPPPIYTYYIPKGPLFPTISINLSIKRDITPKLRGDTTR